MKSLAQHLTQYAAYHRDRRNIITHFIGIPMIVVAVAVLLARVSLASLGDMSLTLAHVVVLATVVFYFRLDVPFGVAMAAFLAASLAVGVWAASLPMGAWLAWGLGLFVVGWAFQFVGHYFEGLKPAFVDDISGLIIGPLFVAAELAFGMGLREKLQQQIEDKVGPTRSGDVSPSSKTAQKTV
jgi:uncharacterized membrane protein YGL010W